MSQTKDIKSQVLKLEEKTPHLKLARLAGIVRGSGSIGFSSAGMTLSLESESKDLILKAQRLIKNLYQIECSIITSKNNLHAEIYEMSVFSAYKILQDLHVLSEDGDLSYDLSHKDFLDVAYLSHFLGGVFLGCGSVNTKAGYHLELVFSSEEIASALQEKLAELEFMPKKVARRASFVVYLKEVEQISDFFALIGASNVVFLLNDLYVEREIRNLANRQTNCITANIDKAVEAANNQIIAIETIDSIIGIDRLDERLAMIARLRILHPDETLQALAEMTGLSKSAVKHRFNKLINIAKELGGKS